MFKKMDNVDKIVAVVLLVSVGLFFYGCTLDGSVEKTKIITSAISETLEQSYDYISVAENIPGYNGIPEATADKIEAGIKTTNKAIGISKAAIGIAKVALPQAAGILNPALEILGGFGLALTSILAFVENRKKKKAITVASVVMKAVNPIKGVGAVISQATKDAGVSDVVHQFYRDEVVK